MATVRAHLSVAFANAMAASGPAPGPSPLPWNPALSLNPSHHLGGLPVVGHGHGASASERRFCERHDRLCPRLGVAPSISLEGEEAIVINTHQAAGDCT